VDSRSSDYTPNSESSPTDAREGTQIPSSGEPTLPPAELPQLAEVRHGTIESNDFLAGETQEVLSLQSRRSLEEM
jgi:hypothetical protein